MNDEPKVFDSAVVLPDAAIEARSKTLLGFEKRYTTVRDHLRLLMEAANLPAWNRRFHNDKLDLAAFVENQYPFVIFHGDVGTGKTATAEAIANRLVMDAMSEDSQLFKLSNRVRGSGMVGEMGTLISEAFRQVVAAVGKTRRAILVIDEGDSLAASRTQDYAHHEDKVGVNTLIQHIDELRKFQGRIIVILCTNRLSILDPALRRRAAIVEEFTRPDNIARAELFRMDLQGLNPTASEIAQLVEATGQRKGQPAWTYSDIRTRLYPAALSRVFPEKPLTVPVLLTVAAGMSASPVMEDR